MWGKVWGSTMRDIKAPDEGVTHIGIGGEIINEATFGRTAAGYTQLVITFLSGRQLICTEQGQVGEFDCKVSATWAA